MIKVLILLCIAVPPKILAINWTDVSDQSLLAKKQFPSRLKPIATYTSNFKDLVLNSDVFVDKTLIIEKLLKLSPTKISLNLPKLWGKSINLHMLKTFLEIEVDEDGKMITPQTTTFNYRLFKKGEICHPNGTIEKLTNPMKISMYRSIFDKYQGNYPVIYLKLGNLNSSSFEEIIDVIKTRTRDAYANHIYIKNAMMKKIKNNITTHERTEAQNTLLSFKKVLEKQLDIDELVYSWTLLCEILHKFHNKKVFLLIDDWEGILYNMIFDKRIPAEDEQRIWSFYNSLLNATFTTNPYLEKCVFVGTLRGLGLFSIWDQFREYHTTSTSFYTNFAFSESEVKALFDHFEIPINMSEKVGDWYNRYHPYENSTENLYNPVSVSNFVCTKKINNYRIQRVHDNYRILRDMVKEKSYRTQLLRTFTKTKVYHMENHIQLMYEPFNNDTIFKFSKKFKFDSKNFFEIKDYKHLIWSHFHDAGYLSNCDRKNFFGLRTRIINHEVKDEILTALMDYYKGQFNITSSTLDETIDRLAQYINNECKLKQNLIDSLQSLTKDISSQEIIAVIVQYIASRVTMQYDFRSAKPWPYSFYNYRNDNGWRPVKVFPDDILYRGDHAYMIKVRVDTPIVEILDEMKKYNYHPVLFELKTIEQLSFIAISIATNNNTVQLFTEPYFYEDNWERFVHIP